MTDGPIDGPTERPAFVRRRARHGLIGPFSGRQLLAAAGAGLAAIVILVLATRPLGTSGGGGPENPAATAYLVASPVPGLRPGDLAPELDGLSDLDGRPIRLADLRGRGVWLNFWASWCPPCQAETPILRDTQAAYRDRGLTLVAIAVQETNVDDIRAYAERYGLRYTIGWDVDAAIFHRYRVYALPTQVFIGPDGIIRDVVVGPLDAEGARRRVESILPEAGVSSAQE